MVGTGNTKLIQEEAVLDHCPNVKTRDRVIDVLRGWFILMMVTSHVGYGSILNKISHFPNLVSAAGGFVFLSGMVLGMVSFQRIRREGEQSCYRRLLHRAGLIALIHYIITFTWAILHQYTSLGAGIPNAAYFGGWPAVSLLILTFRYQPQYLDILPLYVFFILLTPICLWMMVRKYSILLLGLSIIGYISVMVRPDMLSLNNKVFGSEAFHLLAWQFLFVLALCIGYYRNYLVNDVWRKHKRLILIGVVGFTCVMFVLAQFERHGVPARLHPFSEYWLYQLFERSELRIGRLLYLLGTLFTAYLWLHHLDIKGKHYAPLAMLESLGQRSLYCFQLHIWLLLVVLCMHWNYLTGIQLDALVFINLAIIYWMNKYRVLSKIIPN